MLRKFVRLKNCSFFTGKCNYCPRCRPMQRWRTCPSARHVASGAGHVRPLLVNRGAARVDIGRAYILIMIIYIMKGMFVLCGKPKPVGIGGRTSVFLF